MGFTAPGEFDHSITTDQKWFIVKNLAKTNNMKINNKFRINNKFISV